MEDSNLINRRVRILTVFSDQDGVTTCLPKRMVYNGREYNFAELGLRHPTKQGKRMIHVFDMTDGEADYRLEFDAEALTWELISISDSSYAL